MRAAVRILDDVGRLPACPRRNLDGGKRAFILRLGIVAAWLLAAWSGIGEAAARIALLPFENVSGHPRSPAIMMPLIEISLRERDYEVVEPDALEPFLFRQRIRSTGKLSREQLAALGREFGVSLALVGSIDLFADTPGNPQWGVSARLLATDGGLIVWAGAAGYTGDDFTGILGLGTVTSPDELGAKTVENLFRDLPAGGQAVAASTEARAARARAQKRPRGVFRDPGLENEPPKRLAVLPFENGTERPGAALIVDDLMVAALFQTGRFEIVDPGEVHRALRAMGIAPYGSIDWDALRKIGEEAGVDAVVLGRVGEYNEGLRPGTSTSPSIALDARMLDTRQGRILWMGYHEARGEDSQIVLEFGKIKSMVPLAMKVIAELVGTM
jgi:TolB-like protein